MTAKLIIGIVLVIFGGYITVMNWLCVIYSVKKNEFHSSVPFLGGINLTVGLFILLPEPYVWLSFLGLFIDYGTLPILIGAVVFKLKNKKKMRRAYIMWNADIYNRYNKERIQPSVDLVGRLSHKKFKRILDVGCGTGMSTASISAVWKDSEIIGADLSQEMLTKAKEALPSVSFVQRDCSKSLLDMGNFDLIFSNAFIQWIPNQEKFFKNSFAMLNDGGTFAAQIPLFGEMPANQCLIETEKLFSDKLKNMNDSKFVLHSASEYYEMLSKCTDKISMWITDYVHEMDDHSKIVDFLSGTALRPHFEILDENEQKRFLNELLKNIAKTYPIQKNGKVLFPFKRLFLIGEKV